MHTKCLAVKQHFNYNILPNYSEKYITHKHIHTKMKQVLKILLTTVDSGSEYGTVFDTILTAFLWDWNYLKAKITKQHQKKEIKMVLKSSRKENSSFPLGYQNLSFSLIEPLQIQKYGTQMWKGKKLLMPGVMGRVRSLLCPLNSCLFSDAIYIGQQKRELTLRKKIY